ncbi:MAG TPA: MBL fold metallo-hydrolase [Candidatus Xenobia bacterium]
MQVSTPPRLEFEIHDGSVFGSILTARCETTVQEMLAPLGWAFLLHGYPYAGLHTRELLQACLHTEAFGRAAEVSSATEYRLRESFLYPSDVNIVACHVNGRRVVPDRWANLADEIHQAVAAHPAAGPMDDTDLTFVGHNTVVVRSHTTRVIVDPWFLPPGEGDFQPIQRRELGPIDAVLITHSHPDHFDLASLLGFARDTPVLVPQVPRESILAIDMARRLTDLGFSDVRPTAWWQEVRIGDIDVTALPFYGEQPTTGAMLHPAVRNAGNTWLVRTPRCSAAFTADSGRDGQGDVQEVALEACRRYGPLDFLFTGYRGWSMYPIQLLKSSIARYLLFVPAPLWTVRQQLMTSVEEAVDLAERWQARFLVPYADGGAPWYWQRGLGPRLDQMPREHVGVDPFPDHVVRAAGQRCPEADGTTAASSTRPLLLRPGDSVVWDGSGLERVRVDGHRWPFAAG